MNRKDDHLNSALNNQDYLNHFDHVRFIHHALSNIKTEKVDLSAQFLGNTYPLPFFINAMTGGSKQAREINEKLALLAKHFNIPLALGSISTALKNPAWEEDFKVSRRIYQDGTLLANLGAEHTLDNALKAIELIKADGLQIHLNNVQEIVMPEGDRDFSQHYNNLKILNESLDIPIIVKEVGFGMSFETLKQLKDIGIKTVDVAGKGGTNFSKIENLRRETSYEFFNDWGQSTVESLLEASKIKGLNIIASGGIRNALDVIKALRLGANFIGMSGWFLNIVKDNTLEHAIKEVENLIEGLKGIMCVLNAKNIGSLKEKPIIFSHDLKNYMNQRNINH